MDADALMDWRDDRLELQRLKQINKELLEALEHLVMAVNRGVPIHPTYSSANHLMPQYPNVSMTTQEAEAVIRKAKA